MKRGHRVRNVLLGAAYLFVIAVVISGLTGDDPDGGAQAPTGTEAQPPEDTVAADGGQEQTEAPQPDDAAASDGSQEQVDQQTAEPATEPPTESTPAPVTEPDPIEFGGSGARVTDRFQIEGGFVAVEYEHAGGSSNFIAELIDPTGDERDRLVANEIGETQGSYGEGIPQGEYVLDVDADGDWTIVVYQPRVAEGGGEDVPFELSGNATDDYVAVNVDGVARVRATHEGEGNFIVESYTRQGERHLDTLVFNEVGQFEGETTLQYDGTTWLVIEADGPWRLSFEPA